MEVTRQPQTPPQTELDPKRQRKIEKGAEAVGDAVGMGIDGMMVRTIVKTGAVGPTMRILGPIGGAYTMYGGATDFYKDAKCVSHPQNNRKWDDFLRLWGDGAEVLGGGALAVGAATLQPEIAVPGLVVGIIGSGLKLVGKLADDTPRNACQ